MDLKDEKCIFKWDGVTLWHYSDGRLYAQGTCYDSAWNAILNRSHPVLLATSIGKVDITKHGFSFKIKPPFKKPFFWMDPWMTLDGTGPSGFPHSAWKQIY